MKEQCLQKQMQQREVGLLCAGCEIRLALEEEFTCHGPSSHFNSSPPRHHITVSIENHGESERMMISLHKLAGSQFMDHLICSQPQENSN